MEGTLMKITVRDGKELDVDLTLEMTRDALETWATDPDPDHPTRGLALALEAALVKLQELEHRSTKRRLLG